MTPARWVVWIALCALEAPALAAQAPPSDAEAALTKARDELRRSEEAVATLEGKLCTVYLDFEKWIPTTRDPKFETQFAGALRAAVTELTAEVAARQGDLTHKTKLTADLRQRIAAKIAAFVPDYAVAVVSQRMADALLTAVGAPGDPSEAIDKAASDFRVKWLDASAPAHEVWNRNWFKELAAARDYAAARAAQAAAADKVARVEHPERFHAGFDSAPEGMVFVIAGNYVLGPNEGYDIDSEKRKVPYTVSVKSFYLDKTEVTNKQYHDFLRSIPRTEAQAHAPNGWEKSAKEGYSVYPTGADNLPVTGVSYEDAALYATWAKKRLPTEEEWEVAARGPRSFKYPWGPDYEAKRANDVNADAGGPAPVGSFPGDQSHFGALDMAGNVMEWTASLERGKEAPVKLDSNVGIVLRGGCFDREPKKCSAVYRWVWPGKTTRVAGLGFRCAKDAF